ncbi:hypothetical protein CLV56_3589 [Mumia flava]|uniref:Uncharacterized protein n=1 Tax=Mumia flava TaxID=1348852 RepID=A0A0B2BU23_9ACTN|nr:hypothetical protein [Mumia flava]PJJ54085.1 hypothetical protein CLV56_3589 [Mumia flava]
MTALVIVVLAACLALPGWAFVRDPRGVRLVGGALTVAWAAAIVATLFDGRVDGETTQDVLVLFALLLAVAGGAVVTAAAFLVIDQGRTEVGGEPPRIQAAGQVLRGGAWIGALERFAVFGALAARWPEGVAIVLAVKGLGRYPELRTGASAGTAERFIIGTMVSVIWASGCVYVALAPYVLPLTAL